jgi:hypothetical protein
VVAEIISFRKEFLKENLLLWGLFKGMISPSDLAAVRIDWLVIQLCFSITEAAILTHNP